MKRNPAALLGAGLLLTMILVSLLAPLLAPYDPVAIDPAHRLAPVSREHLLGTDTLGRDVLSRLLYGGRIALIMSLVAVTCTMLIGMSVGLVTGYYGGIIDDILTVVINILLALPGLSLMLAIAGVLGPGINSLFIAMVTTSWAGFARVVRGEVLRVREEGYVEAARALGASSTHIILRHILPNILGPVVVLATLRVGGFLLAVASLSFLGLGIQPPAPDWAVMLNDGRAYCRSRPLLVIAPGMCIVAAALGANLLGDALRDLLDARNEQHGNWRSLG
ncbi:Glutathione transport system permease protein GsiD [Neomoorella glycerini]|uniref:Glutathione transport system permease protein GsiD n=1 Tax=Neomoorella glycerini TaxID=55779 RepID=A0A6I5ZW85_9FIRM|nr:ABC transporter permease [Moorella glycerini]QGP93848.1 Glutathione transport system permease protein GsiD [Moorella glycerini]